MLDVKGPTFTASVQTCTGRDSSVSTGRTAGDVSWDAVDVTALVVTSAKRV